MSTLVIRKKSLKTWLHIDSDLGQFIISKFYFNADGLNFQIVEQGQSKRVIYTVSDITLYDDTTGGGAETFSTITALSLRLEQLNYPAFQYDGQIVSIANLIDAGTNITITGDGTEASPYVISSSGGGAGSQTLAQTLVLGNITDGEDISISDGDKVLLDNGANLKKGTTDAGLGGSKGIALRCAVDYELKWEAGRLYVMEGDGFTIREVSHNFTSTPTTTDDTTKGFVIGSRWILDNGDLYLCTNATASSAVWELQSNIPTIQQTATAGSPNTDLTVYIEDSVNGDVVDFGSIGLIIESSISSSALIHNFTREGIFASYDNKQTGLYRGLIRHLWAGVNITDLDFVQPTGTTGKILFPDVVNATKTVAMIDQIPSVDATPTDGSSNAVSSNGVFDALALKQNALVYRPYRFLQTSQTAHTGTNVETIIGTATIVGNTFNSNDVMKMIYRISKPSGTAGGAFQIRINTTNTLSGSVVIFAGSFNNNTRQGTIERNFDLQGGNLYGFSFSNSAATDLAIGPTALSSTAFNTANTLFVFFTIQLTNSADSVTPNLCNITN